MLGLDISSSAVKLVELGRLRDGRLMLLHCLREPLLPGWVKEGNVEQFDEVAQAIRQLVRRSGSKTRRVALALPAAAVITKKIVLPEGMAELELEIQVESEAAQYIPFPLSEVSLDFCILGPAPNTPKHVEVLLAASRKDKVSDRQGLAEAAGLQPMVMDIESFASRLAVKRVVQALPGQARDQLVALFEMGSQTTSLQVLRNDEVLYERDQPFGGVQLTHQISRHYGIAFEEAESKKKAATFEAGYHDALLLPFLQSAAQELGRALQFFFTSTPFNKVDYILLSGGTAALPGLVDVVMAHTAFPAKLVNPFEGMGMAPAISVQDVASDSLGYLVATGLALRRFSP